MIPLEKGKMKLLGILVLLLLVGCYGGRVDREVRSPLDSDTAGIAPKEEPPAALVLAQGSFVPGGREGEGTARIVEENGQLALELRGFRSAWEPDLRIYLSDSAGSAVLLGDLRSPRGDQRYPIPRGTDLERYDMVQIRSAGEVFMSAGLEQVPAPE